MFSSYTLGGLMRLRLVIAALLILAGPVLLLSMVGSAQASPLQDAAPRFGAVGSAIDCRVSEAEPAELIRPTVEITADDGNTWEVLARERFMAGDVKGALDAWNHIGQPRVQCVNVEGLVRTRRSAVIGYLGTASGELFTAETFTRIERRLGELPVASRTRLRYDPAVGGSVTITPIGLDPIRWTG